MTAFIRVVPDEIERHGAAAAIVLAHIRFRCASDGPGRMHRDGHRWWRVTRGDIAREIGLTPRAVKHALQLLGDFVVAKEFPPLSDRSLAYRVPATDKPADQPEDKYVQPSQPADQPEDKYVQPGDTYVQRLDKNDTQVGQKRPLHLSLEELKEGVEARALRGAPTAPAGDLQTANSNGRRCARHAHIAEDSDVPSCRSCRLAREAAEAADAEHAAAADARRKEIRSAIDRCRECDEAGRLDDLSNCPKHPNFRTHPVLT